MTKNRVSSYQIILSPSTPISSHDATLPLLVEPSIDTFNILCMREKDDYSLECHQNEVVKEMSTLHTLELYMDDEEDD